MRLASGQERQRALLMLVAAGLFWSTAGVLIVFVRWPPIAIWAMRSLVAGSFLLVAKRPPLRWLTRDEWGVALTHAAATGLFITANKLTSPANAILIQYSAPIWVALLSQRMLAERVSRLDWTVMSVALVGVALFFVEALAWQHTLGNILALLAGVAFALHTVLLRRVAGDAPLRPIIVGNLLAFVIGAYALVEAPALPPSGWLALLALGVVQQGAAYVCYSWAIARVTALEGLLIPIIEPVFSPIWVMVVFGQVPGAWALVGGALVVGAVLARAWSAFATPHPGASRPTP